MNRYETILNPRPALAARKDQTSGRKVFPLAPLPREDRDPRAMELRWLMKVHNLKTQDVANLLERSKKTVEIWRIGSSNPIPESMLLLLKSKLGIVEQESP